MLRRAFRTLWKTPFVTAVAILSLALGIGANGAIFSLFHQMLLAELPVPRAGRLVNLGAPGPKPGSQSCSGAGGCDVVLSYPMFRDLEARKEGIWSGLAAHRAFGANLAHEGNTAAGLGMLVSGGYFTTLGLQPAAGRLIGPGDDGAIGASPVAVLGNDAWENRFGGDPDIVGQDLVVNGRPLTVIGVAPAGFRSTTLGANPDVFVPITLRAELVPGFDGFDNRRSYWVYAFGRLAPSVDLERARAAANVIYDGIIAEVEAPLQEGMTEATMERFLAKELTLEPGGRGQSSLHSEARTPLIVLFAAAGLVLMIACINIANLLLARSAARAGEIAVRLSVGASRLRLIGQLLVESCLLALLGGAAGLMFARWTLEGIGALLPPEAIATVDLALDLRVTLFAALLALGTGVLFGLFPALHSTRLDLASVLKDQAGQASGARSAARFRTVLVTAQIALSTALLVAAGLFTRSLVNVSRAELGLDVERLVTFSVSPEQNGYSPERTQALFARIEEDLASVPGVEAVTASMIPILADNSWGNDVVVEGFEAEPDSDQNARMNQVGPGYFRTMGITLLAGREFTAADMLEAPKVAIVNQAFAEKFGLGRDAVGKRMGLRRAEPELDHEIVGLVANAKYNAVKREVPPMYFRPYRQNDGLGFATFYLRASGPVEPLLAAIPKRIAALDPNLPIENFKTMPQQVRENVYVDRIITTLTTSFAVLATLLAAVGLYGVLAYTVSQRTRELGLRMVLGADGSRVRALVLGQVGRMALIGGAAGLALAVVIGRFARSLLYGLEGWDPAVLALSAVLLAAVALGSGLAPAIRASRIEPMRALRYE